MFSRIVQAAGGKVDSGTMPGGRALSRDADLQPAADVHIDALVFSPHKFVGGPASSGVLVMRRDAAVLDKPSAPGGGTVSFVSPGGHDYLPDLAAREEAGTPNVIGDIRTALAAIVRSATIEAGLDQRAQAMCRAAQDPLAASIRASRCWAAIWPYTCPFVAFRIRNADGAVVHHQLVTRILSDCFGIQVRGGCACAGPYVHRLLGIDDTQSQAIRRAIRSGAELEKPGFVRVNFSSLMSEAELATLIAGVESVAAGPGQPVASFSVANPATAVFSSLR